MEEDRLMELRVLRYFLMVAREENITRAAQLLHITQPTLSRQLMQLEDELGTKLFKRSNHNIYLTEDGMLLKSRAQNIVDLAERTEREFAQKGEETVSGEIVIGSGESESLHEIAEGMKCFQRKYPMVQYEIYTANADDIKERLEKGLVDFGLLMEPVDISKYNFIRLKRRERWGVLVREDSKLADKNRITPEDLAKIPLIMVKRSLVKNEFSGWFGEYYDHLQIAAVYNLLNNAAVMVQSGMGAALCFEVGSHYDHLRFIPLSPEVETGCVLVWKRHQLLSNASEHFLEFMKKYLKSIADD